MSDTCRSCHAPVLFVPSAKSGKPMILNATAEKRIVLGSAITTLEPNDGMVVGAQHPDAPIVARVVDVYTDHHATCSKASEWKGLRR
jgi:hypothetical protein